MPNSTSTSTTACPCPQTPAGNVTGVFACPAVHPKSPGSSETSDTAAATVTLNVAEYDASLSSVTVYTNEYGESAVLTVRSARQLPRRLVEHEPRRQPHPCRTPPTCTTACPCPQTPAGNVTGVFACPAVHPKSPGTSETSDTASLTVTVEIRRIRRLVVVGHRVHQRIRRVGRAHSP